MGTKWNGLNRNKPPRKVSKKKQRSITQEVKIHAEISERANGHCEVCKMSPCPPTYRLSTHELIFRSVGKTAGGVVSLDNSRAVCDCCHYSLQHFLYLSKGKCINFIMITRNTDIQRATEIYRRIYEFCKTHNLLKESKLNHDNSIDK